MKTKPILQIEIDQKHLTHESLTHIREDLKLSNIENEYHVIVSVIPLTIYINSDEILHGS